MGFNAVYRCLMEMFPQIDTRLLKAVAIEHSKDADAAANIVLTEILPHWSKKSLTSSSIILGQNASSSIILGQNASSSSSSSPSSKDLSHVAPSDELAESEELNTLHRRRNRTQFSSLEQASLTSSSGQFFGNTESEEVILLGKTQESVVEVGSHKVSTAMQNVCGNADVSQACSNTESNDLVSLDKVQYTDVKVEPEQTPIVMQTPSVHANGVANGSLTTWNENDFDGLGPTDIDVSNLPPKVDDSVAELVPSSFQAHTSDVPESAFQLEIGSTSTTDSGKPDALPRVCGSDLIQACANTESNGLVSLDKVQYTNVKVEPEQTPIVMPTSSIHANVVANGRLTTCNENDFDVLGATDIDVSNLPLKVDGSVAQLVPSSVQEHKSDVLPESGFQLEIGSTSTTESGKPDAIGSSDLTSKEENSMSEKSDNEDDSTINTIVTRSGQICRIDLLEEMIEDAKNNKKNLFMARDSVMNMMREVEIQEKAAKEAKSAAEKGGLDIFIKMEELKQILAHAKETNDMHAGEIYGEKAILATEARELQNRLVSLSAERDRSLAFLDEMRETLEARLAAAEEMRKAAEEEKFEKEESARAYLAEQEAIMEKVVKESKLLQQQAEENSKLREFLIDRGLVVDSLQGEISVICQDVRLLKEKFDEHVPLSLSVSSSQTTCILASSGSSMKSMASLVAEQGLTSDSPEKMRSPTTSVVAQSPKSRPDDENTGDDSRQLSDDGWDLFEEWNRTES